MLINNLWANIDTLEDVLHNSLTNDGIAVSSNLVPIDTFVIGGVSTGALTLKQAQKRIQLAKKHGASIAFSQYGGEFGQFVSLYKKGM